MMTICKNEAPILIIKLQVSTGSRCSEDLTTHWHLVNMNLLLTKRTAYTVCRALSVTFNAGITNFVV